MAVGRFAPSPTGPLHVGNLRTALVAWLLARSEGDRFVLRIDDADPGARPEHEQGQLTDLTAVGIDWDPPVLRQSARRSAHDAVLADLVAAGLTYPCYCSRREVLEAAAAPHGPGPEGAYTGTCRDLSPRERAARQAEGRVPALRLRAEGARVAVTDELMGTFEAVVDDIVLARRDGLPAYNLTVVLDDHHQGVEVVTRGADLLASTPRQAHLADVLGLARPRYVHVPLVVGPDGRRLAKRDGATTLAELAAAGCGTPSVVERLLGSLGLPPDLERARARIRIAALPRESWVWVPPM